MENYYNNRAYVVGLEIFFLNKLYKLRHNILAKYLEQIQLAAAKFDLDYEEYIESSYILFKTKNTRLSSLIKVLKFALKLKEVFTDSKSIFEFNILIFKTSMNSRLITQKIRNYVLKIPSDNKVWLLSEHNPVINYNAQLSACDQNIQEVLAITERHSQQNLLEKLQEEILLHVDLIHIVNKYLENKQTCIVGILGKPNTGKTAFLKWFCRQNKMMRFVYLTAHSPYQEACYPFVMLLYQMKKYFSPCFRDSQKERLENLLQQIQLTNVLNYKQLEVDIYDLLQYLAEQSNVVLACDNLDNWPIESVELLKLLYQKLSDAKIPLKLVCNMTGDYYPMIIDETIHFPQQYFERISGNNGQRPIPSLVKCGLSIKEKLLAILPSERKDIRKYSNFGTLLMEGLKKQELIILAIIQKYPYVFNHKILAEVFQDSIIYEIVDHLLDYYFLLEVKDHFGRHLFCVLNNGMYSLDIDIPPHIKNNIINYFQHEISYAKANIYSLYILAQNNIFFYEILEYYLYQMLSYGFPKTVQHFINSNIFQDYDSSIKIWDLMYKKSRADLIQFQDFFGNYALDKSNIRFMLPLSYYYYDISDYEKALEINRESIYLFNNNPLYSIYINKVFFIQAKIFIAKCMFKEAIEYINIGQESLQHERSSPLFYQFIYLKVLCLFFEKELHSAISIIEKYNFNEYLELYGEIESYFQIQLLIMRIYFEIGEYMMAKEILIRLIDLAEYYHYEKYFQSISCWVARLYFYAGDFQQGFGFIESIEDCEEKLYFLSEGYYFSGGKSKALQYAVLALKLSLGKSAERKNVGSKEFDNIYSLQEGVLLCCDGKKDPLLVSIKGIAAYFHTFYGNKDTANKILNQITERPSAVFSPFQHIFHYFYYLYLNEHSENNNREDILYLSYAISILQNESSKILNTKIRYHYIYKNYWNNLLSKKGEEHNLLILGNSRSR